jgi:NAD(P)-dependent dehydrogenase (short-subunit alcohol dehydrogenase family)
VAEQIRARGGSVRVVSGDASRPETHQALVADAVAAFGDLDIAFNNAAAISPIS